jgi:hypothetical protein
LAEYEGQPTALPENLAWQDDANRKYSSSDENSLVLPGEERANPLRPGEFFPSGPLKGQSGLVSETPPALLETFPTALALDPNDAKTSPVEDQKDQKKKATSPKESRPPLDLLRENGEFFTNWPKPKLALLITGKIEGYLEPCGCAGMERMKGGMGRRFMLFKQLRESGWPVIGLDVGGLAHGFGRQAEIKFHTLVEGMRAMDYGAITLGETDVKLPAGELVAETANQPSPFVSANVGLFGLDAGMIAKSKILEAGGKKIGITAVLGKSFQKDLQNPEIEFADPEKAIDAVLPELKKNADILVLLAHATMEESTALAKKFPQFNVVVTSGGNPIPPDQTKKIDGSKTIFVEVGLKGMSAIVLGFFEEKGKTTFRYQRVVLDSRKSFIDKAQQGIVSMDPPPSEMKNLMAAFQNQLKEVGFEGLGLRATPYPQNNKESGGKFVGSGQCKSCHEESYRIWKKSGHAKAYETLEKLDPPRNSDPECLSCHVIGWNPQRFFPYDIGYKSQEKTPQLIDVGCESCHGPGEFHCKAEEGSDEAKMEKYRKAAIVTKADAEKNQCRTCHDGDNSPDFDFPKYWPFVEHYENQE